MSKFWTKITYIFSPENEHFNDTPHLKKYTAKAEYVVTLSNAAQYLLAKYPLNVKKWLEYMIEKIKTHRIGEWCYNLAWIYMRYTKPPDSEYAAQLIIKVCKNEKDNLSERQIYNLKKRIEQILTIKTYRVNEDLQQSIARLFPEELTEFPTVMVDAKTLRG